MERGEGSGEEYIKETNTYVNAENDIAQKMKDNHLLC